MGRYRPKSPRTPDRAASRLPTQPQLTFAASPDARAAVVGAHEAAAHRQQGDLGALVAVRHVLEPHRAPEVVELGDHRLERDPRRLGDLLVGRRVDALAVGEQRPAERPQDALLLLGEPRRGAQLAGHERRPEAARADRLAEGEDRAAHPQQVAVGEPPPARQPHAVDPRAVLGEPVVGDGPLAGAQLELGVQARHLGVPRDRDVRLLAPAERDAPRPLGQREDVLTARVVAEDEERRADPLGGPARLSSSCVG